MNRNENEAESFAGNFMAFGEEALFFEVPLSFGGIAFPLWRALSERLAFAARRSNIREWYCPQARTAARSTFHPRLRFHPALRVDFIRECDPFATYLHVSRPPASSIWRCIAGASANPFTLREEAFAGNATRRR